MTEDELAEYQRRRELRESRVRHVRVLCGFTPHPGGAAFHRTKWRLQHPQFGGRVDPHDTKTGADRHR